MCTRPRSPRVLASALIAVVALGAACATNPATGQRQVMLMSEAQEIALGRESDAAIRKEMGIYADPRWQQYVTEVGGRLVRAAHRPTLPWTFTVVDTPAVNAFALPGGFIYITRGILPFLRDESELAAVLAHEVGHVDARHSAQAYSKQTLAGGSLAVLGIFVPETQPVQGLAGLPLQALFLKFSREDELQADHLGVGYASSSGWDPRGMSGLLATLARLDGATGSSRGVPNWALTHPPAEDRVTRVQQTVAAAQSAAATTTNRAELERRLDGITFGDSREKGIVRGAEFLHPILRIAMEFPSGWDVSNGESQVAAREKPDGQAAVVLEVSSRPSASARAAAATMVANGFREASGSSASIHGLDAYVGTYEGTVNGTSVVLRAAHIQAGGQTYVVAGLASSSDFARLEPQFTRAIQSFRTLTPGEAERIQANHVDFYTVRAGDSWDSISRGAASGTVKAATLAIMNGRAATTAPVAGERIRIVVGG